MLSTENYAPYPRLKGKIVLITGASAGIGEATARQFAASGSHLIITARRNDRLQSLKKELEEKCHVKVFAYPLDVSKHEEVQKFVEAIPTELKEVDILVNNAGLAIGVNKTYENVIEDVNTMIDTNVKGVLFMIRAFIPGMLQRKRGHVINVGSIAGREAYAGGSVYCGSKSFVDAISSSLRQELISTPLRSTLIAPGLCETEYSLVRFGGDAERAKSVYKGLKPLISEDVADTICYAASRPPHVVVADMLVLCSNQGNAYVVHREQN